MCCLPALPGDFLSVSRRFSLRFFFHSLENVEVRRRFFFCFIFCSLSLSVSFVGSFGCFFGECRFRGISACVCVLCSRAWMHSAQCTRHILVGYHWKVHSSWTPLFMYIATQTIQIERTSKRERTRKVSCKHTGT